MHRVILECHYPVCGVCKAFHVFYFSKVVQYETAHKRGEVNIHAVLHVPCLACISYFLQFFMDLDACHGKIQGCIGEVCEAMTPCQGDSVIWPTQNLRGRKYNQAEQSRAICKMCTTNNIVKDEWDSNSIHSVALQLQPCNDAVIEEPRNSEILDNNRRPEYNSIS